MDGGFLPEPESRQGLSEPPAASWAPQPAGQRATQPHRHGQPQRYVPPSVASAPLLSVPDDVSPEAQGGCSRCASVSFNSEWLKAFGVVLCNHCKKEERLITKSTAKQQYSVSDSDLSRLGSLRKANPHKKDWQAMHLYMESQVARVAHDKHGGEEGLRQHHLARAEARLQSKLKRRQDEKRKAGEEETRLARVKQRLEVEEARRREAGGAAGSGSEVEEI